MFLYLLYFGKFFGKYQRCEEKNAQLKIIIVDNYNSEKIKLNLILGKKICFYYYYYFKLLLINTISFGYILFFYLLKKIAIKFLLLKFLVLVHIVPC